MDWEAGDREEVVDVVETWAIETRAARDGARGLRTTAFAPAAVRGCLIEEAGPVSGWTVRNAGRRW